MHITCNHILAVSIAFHVSRNSDIYARLGIPANDNEIITRSGSGLSTYTKWLILELSTSALSCGKANNNLRY